MAAGATSTAAPGCSLPPTAHFLPSLAAGEGEEAGAGCAATTTARQPAPPASTPSNRPMGPRSDPTQWRGPGEGGGAGAHGSWPWRFR